MDKYNIEIFQGHFLAEAAKNEIRECNTFCERFGLSLSEEEIAGLVESRARALRSAGRVEFGGGILPKLIFAFCDSPFVDRDTFAELLTELQEAFYYYKSEAMDRLSDDEIIEYMEQVFNGPAQGSMEYLSGTSLDALCRQARRNRNGL